MSLYQVPPVAKYPTKPMLDFVDQGAKVEKEKARRKLKYIYFVIARYYGM